MGYSYDLTVAICTHNRCGVLNETLGVLSKQIEECKFNIQTIIIDNNSSDNTKNIVKDNNFSESYYFESKPGLSHARNAALDLSEGRYICFIDDDAVPCENWLNNVVTATKNNPNIEFFGGRIIPDPEVDLPRWFDKAFWGLYSLQDFGTDLKIYPLRVGPVGANMIISLKAVGVERFDPRLGRIGNNLLSGEETEFLIRLGFLDKHSMYLGNASVIHKFPRERYEKKWAIERFRADGISSRVMLRVTPSYRGLLSPMYNLLTSLRYKNWFYTYCHIVKVVGFFRGK
ncbi:glycosyltransferase [Vibrio parahaemolyticus]|nr:glycosyltransferase [Vibrio parahaemolyticus]EIA1587610.1 glycosyltransferase [Vibrio parahaemolyticus]